MCKTNEDDRLKIEPENMQRLLLLLTILSVSTAAFALNNSEYPAAGLTEPKVFLDCGTCNFNYIRTHVRFVNYVRDRNEAQVEVLVTAMPTGGGGREFTLIFLGRKRFEGMNDTLECASAPSETSEEIMEAVSRKLELGLVRYAERMPIARCLSVDLSKHEVQIEPGDKWDHWVFNIGASGYLNGQALTTKDSWAGSATVSRTTRSSKFLFSGRGVYQEDRYTTDGQPVIAITRQKTFEGMGAFSLGSHWSVGGILSSYSSTYNNEKEQITLSPEIEYDIFPYSQATLRQLRFRYELSYQYSSYYLETIFNKLYERLGQENLSLILDLTQPWGTINASLNGANYFNNFSENHLQFYTQISLALAHGFSVNLSGAVSLIHDQISLPQTGATADQILLQQTELATQYSYWTSLGLSFTFGSIYNDIVNPRLW